MLLRTIIGAFGVKIMFLVVSLFGREEFAIVNGVIICMIV